MTDTLIEVRDGVASPGDTLHFVTASGRDVRAFVLDREERPEFPARDRYLVAVGSGLYDADSCYLDLRRAEAEADRLVAVRTAAARRELGLEDAR